VDFCVVYRLAMPTISYIRGNLNISSTLSLDCSIYYVYHRLITKESYACAANAAAVVVPSSTSSSTSGSAGSGSATPGSNANDTGSGGGLNMGAKIGLGVGIPVVVLLFGVVGFFAFGKKRKNKKSKKSNDDNGRVEMVGKEGGEEAKPNLGTAEMPSGGHHEKTELSAGDVEKNKYLEMGDGNRNKREGRAELSGFNGGPVPEAHELYGGDVKPVR